MVYRLNMALELAKHNAVYEDIASKFFEVQSIDCGRFTSLTSFSTLSSFPMP